MAFLVDDVVEAALGPWGVAIGLGIAAAVASRRRLQPIAASASRRIAPLAASASGTAAPLATVAAGGLVRANAAVGRIRRVHVKRDGQAVFFGLTRSFTDLYDEARAEFEAKQAARATRWTDRGERSGDIVAEAPDGGRDSRGRFVKRSASPA